MAEGENVHNEHSGDAETIFEVGAVKGNVLVLRPSSARLSVDEAQTELAEHLVRQVRALSAQEVEPSASCHRPMKRSKLAPGQARAIFLPGIGSASAVRHSGAPKASAKYCVSCTTCPWANSIMLTE